MSSMRRSFGCIVAAATVVGCADAERPTIFNFASDVRQVSFGSSTILRWDVVNADRVVIATAVESLVETSALQGEVTTPVLDRSTQFVLTAFGDGQSVSQALTVAVDLGPAPAVDVFVAEPSTVVVGQAVRFAWRARNADEVRIQRDGMLVLQGGPVGTATISATETSPYTLTAIGAAGRTATATLAVAVQDAVRIERFSAEPNAVDLGNPVTLAWRAPNATRVRIGDAVRTLVDTVQSEGTILLRPDETTRYVLTAEQGDVQRTAEVTVAVVTPDAFSAVAGTRKEYRDQSVQGSWSRRYAIETTSTVYLRAETFSDVDSNACSVDTVVELQDRDGRLIGDDDNDGVRDCGLLDPGFDTFTRLEPGLHWVLVRSGGLSADGVMSYDLVVEAIDPADCCVGEVALSSAEGRIAEFDRPLAVGEVRRYAITTTKTVGLFAATFSGRDLGQCSIDTIIRFYDPDGNLLGVNDDDATGTCSLLAPQDSSFMVLEPGRYPLTVEEFGLDEAIEFSVAFLPITIGVCGNGIVEPAEGETCDDGDTVSGDGCDAECKVEAVATFIAQPGASETFSGPPIARGDVAVFEITVPETVTLNAETFSDAATRTCPFGTDTFMRLTNVFGLILASDDDGGVNRCSRVGPPDPGATVGPGTYLLRVSGFSLDAVPAYELVLTASSP